MPNRYCFLLIAFTLASFNTSAQLEEDFENFSKYIFESLTDTSKAFAPEYIRIDEYKALIDLQKASNKQKEMLKHQIDGNYTREYIRYENNVNNLEEEYDNEVVSGAKMEYINTYWEPLQGSEYSYTIETSFFFFF